MARFLSTRAWRARELAVPAALALVVLGVVGLALFGTRQDARRDLEERFADRATTTAALVDALLRSTAESSGAELSQDGGRRRTPGRAVYTFVAGKKGRAVGVTGHLPATAVDRARRAIDRLDFPGAPAYLLVPVGDGLLEITIPFRSGRAKRVQVTGLSARSWAGRFDSALERAMRPFHTRALIVDGAGTVFGDSGGRVAADGGFSATARIGSSPLHVRHVTSRDALYAPIGGSRGWAPWLALGLAALAMGGGLWLMARLRSSHLALRRSEQRHALAMRAANDALWDWDLETGDVHYSERWLELVGDPESAGIGRWLDLVHPDDRAALEAAIDAHLDGQTPFLNQEHRLRAAGGNWIWVLVRGLAVFDRYGRAIRCAGSLSDVTARRRAIARLEHQATHDPLTGLANRAHFFSMLERSLERSRRGEHPSPGVVFLDLDGFKLVNDRFGHVFGDAVLATVAARLLHCVRPGDVVGRLGGDEMAVLLPACPDYDEAAGVAERLGSALREPYEVLGEEICVSASAGVAVADLGDTAEELLREADAAMYRAKLAV